MVLRLEQTILTARPFSSVVIRDTHCKAHSNEPASLLVSGQAHSRHARVSHSYLRVVLSGTKTYSSSLLTTCFTPAMKGPGKNVSKKDIPLTVIEIDFKG